MSCSLTKPFLMSDVWLQSTENDICFTWLYFVFTIIIVYNQHIPPNVLFFPHAHQQLSESDTLLYAHKDFNKLMYKHF